MPWWRSSWIRCARRVRATLSLIDSQVWTVYRMTSRRVAVNETARAGSGLTGRVGVAGSGTAAAARPAERVRSVAVSQAQNSWATRSGVRERRIGPRDGPASVMVDLSSLNVVSDPFQRHG